MEENEIEETIETPTETEVEETIDESVEEVADDTPTIEDYNKLKQEAETLKAQKDHWRKKAESKKPLAETNKPEGESLSRDEVILIAKGYTDEEVALALKLSKVQGISMLEAIEDDYLKSKINARKKKEKSEQASLGASTSSVIRADKPIGEMTDAEHEALYRKTMAKV